MSAGGAIDPERVSVAVGWCRATPSGAVIGSDGALLAAAASGGHVLAIRSGVWDVEAGTVEGARLERVAPPLGRPGLAGGAVRRRAGDAIVPVWAEPGDAARIRGFRRAPMGDAPKGGIARVAHGLRSVRLSDELTRNGVARVVVLTSHPGRLEARGLIYATTLAAVAGRRTQAVLPRGVRASDSGRRYLRGLGPISTVETVNGPSWLALGGASAAVVDVAYERSTRYGGLLIELAEAMGVPVVDLPGDMPVGARHARLHGLPLVEALERAG
ncbi:MAG: hypothetical protein ACF8Q5_11450 [Phycisphaerales bacterium JB040]